MSAAPNSVRVGQDLTYTITVTNHGPAFFKDGYVSCTVARLASGERWSVPFTVRPNRTGPIRNRVTVGGAEPDPTPGNNSASVETAVR